MNDLAYVGKITAVQDIEGADRIKLVTAVCGKGGIWRGIMPISAAEPEREVVVFQPDSIVDTEHSALSFMSQYHGRVRQRKFRGCPSEALIIPAGDLFISGYVPEIGTNVTEQLGVQKYEKPGFKGTWQAEGYFPAFLRKTDEVNFQKVPEMVARLRAMDVTVRLKMDGMSTTAFQIPDPNGGSPIFGVCSRNMQIKEGDNPFWQVANYWNLRFLLPVNFAVQFETCGPNIQKNPIGLPTVEGYAFDWWNIETRRYEKPSMQGMPMQSVPTLAVWKAGEHPDWQDFASTVKYANGKPAEGIVIRPAHGEVFEHVDREYQRFSCKVINLNYKD